MLHHPEYRERYAANLKRELPRIPYVGAASDSSGRVGLQASVKADSTASSSLPKASAKSDRTERQKQTADPSPAPAKADSARDDKDKEVAERGAEAPLYQSTQNAGRGAEAPLYPNDKAVFWAFAKAGQRLAEIHVNYEQQPEYLLERVEKGQLSWRVAKMRLSKDKATLVYNDFLTLRGIPPETYEYRLGNRSALEWVVDQYQVSTDKRSGITNDPNRADDLEYIVRLIGQVITVSLETMQIVKSLPPLSI